MHRGLQYMLLFVLLAAVQVFLLNNLSLSVYIAPMIYVALIIMLPLETPSAVTLLLSLAMGMLMDCTMGVSGLNVIATVAVGYLRRPLLRSMLGEEALHDGGIPSRPLMGARRFRNYIVQMVGLHSLIFIALETLSLGNITYTLLRFLLSTASTLLLMWIGLAVLAPKHSARL